MHFSIARCVSGLLIACGVGLLAACGGGADTDTATGSAGCPASTRSLSVKATCVASIEWGPEGRALAIGQSVVFSATAFDAARTPITDQPLTFSSSQPAVATVSNATARGVTVTAVANGVTTLTASLGGKSSTITLTVGIGTDIQVTGRVIDGETRAGIAATVEYQEQAGRPLGGNVTAADGSFSFAAPPDVVAVRVTASKAGFVTTTLLQSLDRAGTQLETIVLVRETATPGAITGTVRDATNGNGINGARVELHRGQGFVVAGGVVATASTDAAGTYSFAGLAAGTYTVVASKADFRVGQRTAITVLTTSVERQDVVLSPEGAAVNVRIVLTWGSTPADLDAHLTGPNPSDANRFHVFYSNRLSAGATPFAGLDVDRRDGNGPETISLTKLNPGGFYRYSVHDYTNGAKPGLTELGQSGAKVELYTANGLRTFFVPNQAGNLWTVFELSGDIANPTITDRNAMGAAPLDEATIP